MTTILKSLKFVKLFVRVKQLKKSFRQKRENHQTINWCILNHRADAGNWVKPDITGKAN